MRITLRLAGFVLAGLATFFVGVFVTRALVQTHREPSAWQVLLSFENQDFGALDGRSNELLHKAVTAVTHHPSKTNFIPRLFRTITNTNGEKRYILVEEAPLIMIPGNTRLRVYVFDTAGRILNEEEFNGGYRTVLTSIQVRRLEVIGSQVLVVQGGNVFGGHSLLQYYVLLGNRISLVYIELDGLFYRNNYQAGHMTFGPQVEHSVDEWDKALHSSDEAEVLTALLWLGGLHWNGEPAPYDSDKGEAEKVSTLWSREHVRKRVLELEQSDRYWIKDVAASVISERARATEALR